MATTKPATRARRSTSSKATSAKTSAVKKIRGRKEGLSYKTLWKNQLDDNAVLVEKAAAFQVEARQERAAAKTQKDNVVKAYTKLSSVEINYSTAKRAVLVLTALLVLSNVLWSVTR